MKPKSDRILTLDGLRGVAILAVFIHHAYQAKLLWMGVDLFFVLSGFLITGVLLKQKSANFGPYIHTFYAKRVRRLLPGYAMMLVIVTVLFGSAWMKHWYLFIGGMNFIMPFGMALPNYLRPLWSLAVEEQFYLVWPIAVFLLGPKHLKTLAWALIIAAPILRFVCTPHFFSPWAVYMLLPFRMDTLAVGALIALTLPEMRQAELANPHRKTLLIWTSAAAAILGVAGLVYLGHLGVSTYANTSIGNTAIYELALLIVTSMFFLAISNVGRPILTNPILRFIGTISYSLYLIHEIARAQYHNTLVAAAISLAYASAMWFFLEKPIIERKWFNLKRKTVSVQKIAACLLILLGGIASAGGQSVTLPLSINEKTVFLGDSITRQWKLPKHNAGIPGQRTAQIEARFQADVVQSGLPQVVLLTGANDIRIPGPNYPAIFAGIQEMVEQGRVASIDVILCELPPIACCDTQVRTLNAMIKDYATAQHLTLVDYYTPMAGKEALYLYDGLHPNNAGYAVMEDTLTKTLQPAN